MTLTFNGAKRSNTKYFLLDALASSEPKDNYEFVLNAYI